MKFDNLFYRLFLQSWTKFSLQFHNVYEEIENRLTGTVDRGPQMHGLCLGPAHFTAVTEDNPTLEGYNFNFIENN